MKDKLKSAACVLAQTVISGIVTSVSADLYKHIKDQLTGKKSKKK